MAWVGALLCRLGARFPDAALERGYREFRAKHYFLRDDGFQAAVRAGIIGAMSLRGLVLNGPTAGTAAMFGLLTAPLLQLAMRWLANRRGRTEAALAAYLVQRSAWALVSRAVFLPVVVSACFLEVFQPPGPSTTWPQLASYILYSSGAVVLLLACVAYPMLLEHHLAIQPLAVLAVAYRRLGPFCEEALAADGGDRHVLAAWRAIEAASREVLAVIYMRDIPAQPDPDPLPACGQVALALYGSMGLVAASYVLWLMEHKSRIHFLDAGGRGRCVGWEPVGGLAILFHMVLGAACLAVAWQVLGAALPDRACEGARGVDGVAVTEPPREGEGLGVGCG